MTRDEHLFGPGPKRILALDGGGVRGVVALAFLDRLERMLSEQAGKQVLLCDYFDLIGGTSTGAIIATGLALGYTTAQIRDFYHRLAPSIFKPPRLPLPGLKARFDANSLLKYLEEIIGDRTLDSDDLRTGLGIILKRIDTGSAWTLTNNPRSKYWETSADGNTIGNRHYSLAQIVRASTAAPHYFDPQQIDIVKGEKPGVFVDGGMTPHNNPALALFIETYVPVLGLSWNTGPENLTIVSVGAGTFREKIPAAAALGWPSFGLTLRALVQQIGESQQLILMLMSLMSESPTPWPINAALGDLGSVASPNASLFKFMRYDIKLEEDWLRRELGATPSAAQLKDMRHLDKTKSMPMLEEYATKAAEMQIKPEHFALG